MFKKYALIFSFLIIFVLPGYSAHAQVSNVGFVPGNIWYSKDPFAEGDKIKIYTLLFNPDERQLSGTVEFFDDTTLLGKKNFIVEAKGVKDISIDWTVNVGEHKIFARIENAKFLTSKGKYEDVTLDQKETGKSLRTVNKKLLPGQTEPESTTSPAKSILGFVEEKIPGFISQPTASIIDSLEGFRTGLGKTSEEERVVVKEDIKTLEAESANPDPKVNKFNLKKPFDYAELFLLTVAMYVLGNKFIFYGILIVILILLIRFVWRMIF